MIFFIYDSMIYFTNNLRDQIARFEFSKGDFEPTSITVYVAC